MHEDDSTNARKDHITCYGIDRSTSRLHEASQHPCSDFGLEHPIVNGAWACGGSDKRRLPLGPLFEFGSEGSKRALSTIGTFIAMHRIVFESDS